MIAAAALKALELLSGPSTLLDRLHENASRFRDGMESNGFEVPPGEHPIVPIMLSDATLAQSMAERLLARGIYVIGFSFSSLGVKGTLPPVMAGSVPETGPVLTD